jgi:hypothetical protein
VSEIIVSTSEVMALVEEQIRPKREPIVLEHLNLMQYLRPILQSVLSFLF